MPSVDTRYRLIVLDVDGTLVDHERRISPTTLQALAAAKTAGIRVTLATARMDASALPSAQKIRAKAPLIRYNGARGQDPVSRLILSWAQLSRHQAVRGLQPALRFGLHAGHREGHDARQEGPGAAAQVAFRG